MEVETGTTEEVNTIVEAMMTGVVRMTEEATIEAVIVEDMMIEEAMVDMVTEALVVEITKMKNVLRFQSRHASHVPNTHVKMFLMKIAAILRERT